MREVTKANNVILGDFNCLHIDQVNMCLNQAVEVRFQAFINDYALDQH